MSLSGTGQCGVPGRLGLFDLLLMLVLLALGLIARAVGVAVPRRAASTGGQYEGGQHEGGQQRCCGQG